MIRPSSISLRFLLSDELNIGTIVKMAIDMEKFIQCIFSIYQRLMLFSTIIYHYH
jgi:hypothetical protein